MVIENIKSIIGYSRNSLPKDFIKLIDSLKEHQEVDQHTLDLIYDAYNFGKQAHKGQKRKSGEPYFNHCIAVATILADWGMDQNIIKSFRNYHILTDGHNIIENNIVSSTYSTFNSATVEYSSGTFFFKTG